MAVNAAVGESSQKAAASGIDILDYESNPTATEFVLNDIAGMEKLAELVNSGKDNFKGKTITLTANLQYDKNVVRNHQIIGEYGDGRQFQGTFDGAGHIISGINSYNDKFGGMGLFGYIKDAKLTRIILEDSIIENWLVGGIAGWAEGDTVIDQCAVGNGVRVGTEEEDTGGTAGGIVGWAGGGKITVSRCVVKKDVVITGKDNAGGIVGIFDDSEGNGGSINVTRCINYATVKGKDESSCGGILASMAIIQANAVKNQINRCTNYGTIYCGDLSGSGENITAVAGIAGYSQNTEIDECCNMGQIIFEGNYNDSRGGIVGIELNTKAINCYNAGQLISKSDYNSVDENKKGYAGGIIGRYDGGESGFIQNCYSVGKVQNGRAGAITSLYEIEGHKLSNCYWLTGSADVGVCEAGLQPDSTKPDISSVFEYSQSKMQAQAFVDELNTNSKAAGYGEVWAPDTENINNGYPVLKNVPYKISDLAKDPVDDENNTNTDESLDTTPVSHFYEDHNYVKQATNSTIYIYANGGTVAVPGTTEKKNYKRCILYTDILPSYIYTAGKNGAIKPSSGKVVVGITASNQKPTLVKGKIIDKSTSKIASASIKSGQITVTAKSQPGNVYLWAIDTGRAGESACIPVTVKGAPTTAYIYSIPDTDPSFAYGATKQFKSGQVGIGESIKVYLYPAYKQNGVVQKAKNVKYTASVAVKAADYFSVAQSGSNPYCFEISAKGLKSGKSVAGAITFTCNLNGKKAVFKATAINPVTNISTVNENGLTKNADNSFNIKASDTAKISGTFELQPVCASNTDATTDKLKIYAMGSANGYDTAKLEAGKVQITAKKTSAQGKVSLKPAKDKKTVTVTVSKGAKPATAYFLVVYNTINNGSKKGYTVISVTIE